MATRVRVVGYVVQPRLMVDDGENLYDLNVEPAQVSAVQWPNVVELMAGAVADVASKLAGANAPESSALTVLHGRSDDDAAANG